MNTYTDQTLRSRSLVSLNLTLLLCGVAGLLLISWLVLQPSINPQWYRIALLLQLAALLRVVAGAVGNYQALVVLSGVVWMLAFALFVVRYLPMLVQPRVDGKPG